MKRFCFATLLIVCIFSSLTSQEALKSTEEDYYSFLSLQGMAESPTLGYRTLSDNVWTIETDENGETIPHIWQDNNLGTTWTIWQDAEPVENWFMNGIKQGFFTKIYGPEWFNSFNTAAPYGQNDGALWQGRGYNTSLTAGIRFEGYGFEATFKPQLSFSQNLEFEYITPYYSGANYAGKADTYGYYGVPSLDAPQRFGDKPFFTYDWGDSEIRWSWKSFTVGFGTQAIWLGPAKLNPIIHSNNAPTYPKVDIGVRKTSLYMPYFGWYLGEIELRGWWGKLTESDYFDNDDSNNNNLLSGFSVNYSIPFLPGLTVGLNRIMLSKWKDISPYSLFTIMIPGMDDHAGTDDSDQRASITANWKLPEAGIEIYLEWGRNDYSPTTAHIIRYPFHSHAYTAGFAKSFTLFGLTCILNLELTNLESSRDYGSFITGSHTFYSHSRISQGHTNLGQWLGAGSGTGSNSQYLSFSIFYSSGSTSLFIQRMNPDLDYLWYIDSQSGRSGWDIETSIKAYLIFGVSNIYYILSGLSIDTSIIYERIYNTQYKGDGIESVISNNISIQLCLKYSF